MALVAHDPIAVMVDFFEPPRRRRSIRAAHALHHRPWHRVRPVELAVGGTLRVPEAGVSSLDALRRSGLPLYIALPWKETAQHDELLEIVVRQRPEFGRAHYPAKIRSFERRLGVT